MKTKALWVWIIALLLICLTCVILILFFSEPVPAEHWFTHNWQNPKDVPDLLLEEFPGITFRFREDKCAIEAIDGEESTVLIEGLPIHNCYLYDLNEDGYRELCATVSVGVGVVDQRVIVYDYRAQKSYVLSDRSNFDYGLTIQDGELVVYQMRYLSVEIIKYGKLELQRTGSDYQLIME